MSGPSNGNSNQPPSRSGVVVRSVNFNRLEVPSSHAAPTRSVASSRGSSDSPDSSHSSGNSGRRVVGADCISTSTVVSSRGGSDSERVVLFSRIDSDGVQRRGGDSQRQDGERSNWSSQGDIEPSAHRCGTGDNGGVFQTPAQLAAEAAFIANHGPVEPLYDFKQDRPTDPGTFEGGVYRRVQTEELSAATYRLFAYNAASKGDFELENKYLQKATQSQEPSRPVVNGSGYYSEAGKWDYYKVIADTYPTVNGAFYPGQFDSSKADLPDPTTSWSSQDMTAGTDRSS